MIHFLRKLQAFLAFTVSSILLSRIYIENSEFKNNSKSLNLKTLNFLHLCVKILQVNRLGPPSYCRKSVRSEIVVIVSPYYGVSYHWYGPPVGCSDQLHRSHINFMSWHCKYRVSHFEIFINNFVLRVWRF